MASLFSKFASLWRWLAGFTLLGLLLASGLEPLSSLRTGALHIASAQSDYDWPTLAHDMRRSGSTPVGPIGPYTKDWYRDLWSELGEQVVQGYQPVIVHDPVHSRDLVYVGTTAGALYALDLDTGDTFWRYPAPGSTIGAILSSPTVDGGIVFVAALDGRLYALDGANVTDGVPALAWTFTTGREGGFWGTPAVSTDSVFLGGRDGYFYALNRASGAKRWEYQVGAPILSSPAYDNDAVYFAAENMRAYALNATGTLLWQSGTLAGQSLRGYYPVLADNLVMFRSTPHDELGKVLWEGEQVLAYAAGCTSYPAQANYDRTNAPCFQWRATASSQADYDREDQAVRSYLSGAGYAGLPGRPQYETFHALRIADGQKPYVAPILWTAGWSEPGVPPVVGPDGRLWVLYRSYYSDYDTPSWFIMSAFGQMDPATGAVTLRNPNPNPSGYACYSTGCDPWFATNVWMISDETTAAWFRGAGS